MSARLCALLLASSPLVLVCAARAEPVTAEVRSDGPDLELVFAFSAPAEASITAQGARLDISFSRTAELNLAVLADRLAGRARLVRQSPDGLTLSVILAEEMSADLSIEGPRIKVRLVPPGALPTPPPSSAEATAAPVTPVVAAPQLTISRGEGFSRLAFEFPFPVAYEVLTEGNRLDATFTSPTDVPIDELRVDPPPGMTALTAQRIGGKFALGLTLAEGVTVRHHQEGPLILVDLVEPPAPQTAEAPLAAAPAGEAGSEQGIAQEHAAGSAHDEPLPPGAPQGEPAASLVATQAHLSTPMRIVPVVERQQKTLNIRFAVGEGVALAATRRDERFWLAFAAPLDIDLAALSELKPLGVLGAETAVVDGGTVLGLLLEPHILATTTPSTDGWVLALGDAILSPTTDIVLERVPGEAGGDVRAEVAGAPVAITFQDPDVGDDIIFIAVPGPRQGLISLRRFVEFELLPSAQGLTVRPLTDDISVSTRPGEALITDVGGLSLSNSGPKILSKSDSKRPVGPSPAYLDLARWRGDPEKDFDQKHRALLSQTAEADEAGRGPALLDLARFLFAHDIAEETLGVLGVLASEAPEVAGSDAARFLRGAANLKARRIEAARRDLAPNVVVDDPHKALWHGLMAAEIEDWAAARLLFSEGDGAIPAYEPEWQMRFRIAAARAALKLNDIARVRDQVERMPLDHGDRDLTAEAAFIEGELAAISGDSERAGRIFRQLADGPVSHVAAEAALAEIRTGLNAGTIKPEDGINRLEALRFRWRGDKTEQDVLLALGSLYARLGDYRHALSTMRLAVRYFAGTPAQRRATREMQALFEELFLRGKADEMPPVQALGLYYDFKELTPVGPKGDTMIRRLADRLAALDLLDQATELLKHQVENRLRGVARSQIAVHLAALHLQNRQPEKALRTIHETRLARLPESVNIQRRLVEARALMDLERFEHAIEVLSGDRGIEAERLRAEIYWRAKDWANAGALYEAGVDGVWQEERALTDSERVDVMRAAIAHNLAGDAAALARLQQKFSAKMKDTADGAAFDIVTGDSTERPVQFRALAERIASLDTFARFMADLRAKDPQGEEPAPAEEGAVGAGDEGAPVN